MWISLSKSSGKKNKKNLKEAVSTKISLEAINTSMSPSPTSRSSKRTPRKSQPLGPYLTNPHDWMPPVAIHENSVGDMTRLNKHFHT
jgi:hypothetical protein